jgi:uncharacterized membrane protein YfcA
LLDVATTIAILVAVGLGAGTLGSLLGVGGGILMVPALTLLGLPPTQAAGTSLFAVASTSVSSTAAYSRQKRIDYRLGIEMAASAIPGAVVGGFVSTQITAPDFKLYFGILLMAVGGYIAFKDSILKEKESHRVSALQHAAVFSITFGAGIISSLFGVGGGVIFVPVMLLIHRMTMHRAVPTSQLTLMLTAFAGLFTHVALGHIDYLYAIALSAGAFAGAQIGAKWSRSVKNAILQKMLAVLLVAVAIKFIADWLGSRP